MSWLDDYTAYLNDQSERMLHDYTSGNSQQAWEAAVTAKTDGREKSPRLTGNAFLAATTAAGGPRINAGIGTGDIAIRNPNGNITGYQQRNRGPLTPGLDNLKAMQTPRTPGAPAVPLATASGTPGLDALHAMNPAKTMTPKIELPRIVPNLPLPAIHTANFFERVTS